MRIGCLQFAPQVGDVDNNLNRADSVLSKANLEELDLLVLPEMAFSGYNFKSLEHISAFLEPSGSGITALWARTTALKYNCNVVAGYPEKVDVSGKWPTGPEYYNSALVVNEEGETVANYRKNFLYYTDETWALEGNEGFFEGDIPGLGNTSIGICMDLNPYRFETPWHAFEFAFHILECESNLVIVSMAWMTREDASQFSRMPNEPDMETLTYWVTRLEPLIRAENDDEIIIVFCNRCGIEDDVVYAGTSAVVGIQGGEVKIYGVLGRGEKELLLVDTSNPPYAKLVYRPEADKDSAVPTELERSDTPAAPKDQQNLRVNPSQDDSQRQSPTSSGSQASSSQTTPGGATSSRRGKPPPTIQIPPPPPDHEPPSPSVMAQYSAVSAGSFNIPTPSAPSPTPMAIRPKLIIPPSPQSWSRPLSPQPQSSQSTYSVHSVQSIRSNQSIKSNERPPAESTPYPDSGMPLSGYPRRLPDKQIYEGNVSVSRAPQDFYSPITPFDDLMTPMSPAFNWPSSNNSTLRTPVEPQTHDWSFAARSPAVGGRALRQETLMRQETLTRQETATPQAREPTKRSTSTHTVRSGGTLRTARKQTPSNSNALPQSAPFSPNSQGSGRSRSSASSANTAQSSMQRSRGREAPSSSRPSPPKSRYSSRPREQERPGSSLSHREVASGLPQPLEHIAQIARSNTAEIRPKEEEVMTAFPARPASPKSRNCSRSRPADGVSSILIGASPSLLSNSTAVSSNNVSQVSGAEIPRPMSRMSDSRSRSVNKMERTGASTIHNRSETPNRKFTRVPSRGRKPDVGFSPPRFVPVDNSLDDLLTGKEETPLLDEYRISIRSLGSDGSGKSSASPSKQISGTPDMVAYEKVEEVVCPNCPVHGRRSSASDGNESTPSVRGSPDVPVVRHTASPDSKVGLDRSLSTDSQQSGVPASDTDSQAETIEPSSARTPSPVLGEPGTPKPMVVDSGDESTPHEESMPPKPLEIKAREIGSLDERTMAASPCPQPAGV